MGKEIRDLQLADGGEIAFFFTTWLVEARWDCRLDDIAGTSF